MYSFCTDRTCLSERGNWGIQTRFLSPACLSGLAMLLSTSGRGGSSTGCKLEIPSNLGEKASKKPIESLALCHLAISADRVMAYRAEYMWIILLDVTWKEWQMGRGGSRKTTRPDGLRRFKGRFSDIQATRPHDKNASAMACERSIPDGERWMIISADNVIPKNRLIGSYKGCFGNTVWTTLAGYMLNVK